MKPAGTVHQDTCGVANKDFLFIHDVFVCLLDLVLGFYNCVGGAYFFYRHKHVYTVLLVSCIFVLVFYISILNFKDFKTIFDDFLHQTTYQFSLTLQFEYGNTPRYAPSRYS